jgi:type I restriction enzyme S subunit
MEVRPGYKKTEVGVIPEDWDATILGNIGQSLIGLTYEPTDVRSDGILVLRSSNIQEGALRFGDNVFVEMEVPERIMVRDGDILICVRNGSRELIGKCVRLDERAVGMTFGAFMAVFRTSASRFVYQQFQSPVLKKQIHEHLGATINQITNKSLNSFSIPLPPTKAEQETIADALSDADALIDSLEQLIAKKRRIKQGAMQELLTGKRRLPGFSGDWELRALGEIATANKGTQLGSSLMSESGGFAHLNGGMSPSGYTDKWNAPGDTIAISEGGNSCGYVQFMSEPFWCGGHCYSVIPNGVDNRFLYQTLKGEEPSLMGLRVGSGLPNVQKTALLAFQISCPKTHTEQSAIAAILSDMDAEIAALEARLAKARQLKQGMMRELLTGRIRLA